MISQEGYGMEAGAISHYCQIMLCVESRDIIPIFKTDENVEFLTTVDRLLKIESRCGAGRKIFYFIARFLISKNIFHYNITLRF